MVVEITSKRLQLLKEAVPKVSRVAVVWDPTTPFHKAVLKEVEAPAPSLGLQTVTIPVRGRSDFGDAFERISATHVDALFVSETMTTDARSELVAFAARNRLPTMFMNRDYVAAGGLMSYAPNFAEVFRRAADYVDKILKGARPGDLPVEQPTKFELVINLKAARALGLTLRPSFTARADELIQ